jgi:hypothetical protein
MRAIYSLHLTKHQMDKALTEPGSLQGSHVNRRVREAIQLAKPPSQEVLQHVGKIYFFHSMDVFDSEYKLFHVEGTLPRSFLSLTRESRKQPKRAL